MFYSDKPISSVDEDLLKRSSFSELLAKAINNLEKTDTFTIGLFGKWGSGKTSIVKMMLQSLEELQNSIPKAERIIVVHFEPWNISDSNQLLSQFLVRLANEFRRKSDNCLKTVGDALESYSDAFTLAEFIPGIGIKGNIISCLGKNGLNSLGGFLKSRVDSKDIQEQKEYVTKLLADQPNQILVVIDDIDRLSNDQIRQIFQLVTSVAKFPKTTYLLVFDKEIVVRALECVQQGDGEDYLEKIIQMPIQIPDIQKTEIRNILFTRLEDLLHKHGNTIFLPERWGRIFKLAVDPFIKQIRDINRLCNALDFKLSAISEEINFEDLVAVTSIELGIPPLYEWMKDNKATLTGFGLGESWGHGDRTQGEWYELYEKTLTEYIGKGEHNAAVKKKVDLSLKTLSCLFPHFGGKIGSVSEVFDTDLFRKNNQIAHPDKFDRYFHLTIDYIPTKRSELLAAVHSFSASEIAELLLEKDVKDTCCDFLIEMRSLLDEIPKDRIKVLIEALLKSTCNLDSSTTKTLFSIKARDYAERFLYKLFSRLPEPGRLEYWLGLIAQADADCLAILAVVLNMLELGHGRLAAKGTERKEYEQFLDINELKTAENAFVDKAKVVFEQTPLLDFKEWRYVLYLLECFDSEFISDYLGTAFVEDEINILKYIAGSVVKWIGSGVKYELNEDYKKYLTDDRVLQAITNQKKNGRLFTLSVNVQQSCVAFCLCQKYELNEDYEVTQRTVEKTLTSWREDSLAK